MVKGQNLIKVSEQISRQTRLLPPCPETLPAAFSPSLPSCLPAEFEPWLQLLCRPILWCRNVSSKWSCTTAAVIIRCSSQQPQDDLPLLHQHSFWVFSYTNSPNSSHSFTIWSKNRLGLARNGSPGKCNSADRISSYHYPQQTKVTPGNFKSMSAQE